jgi:hypothetical protein
MSGGLFADVIMPRNHGRLSLFSELAWSTYRAQGYWSEINVELEAKYLKFNNFVKYKVLNGDFNAYLKTGITNGFLIDLINTQERNTLNGIPIAPRVDNAIKIPLSSELGIAGGAGLGYKNFFFEIRYERSQGLVSAPRNIGSPVSRISFLSGYAIRL